MKKLEMELDKLEEITDILSLSTCYLLEDFVKQPLVVAGSERLIMLGMDRIYSTIKLIAEKNNIKIPLRNKDLLDLLSKEGIISKALANTLKKLDSICQDCRSEGSIDKKELYYLTEECVFSFRQFKDTLKIMTA